MSTLAATPRQWKKPPLIKSAWLRWSLGLGFALYLALAFGTTEVNWVRVWEGLPRGARFFAAFFPPDFTSRWSEIAEGIVDIVAGIQGIVSPRWVGIVSGVISLIAGIVTFTLPGLAVSAFLIFGAIMLIVVSVSTLLTLPRKHSVAA